MSNLPENEPNHCGDGVSRRAFLGAVGVGTALSLEDALSLQAAQDAPTPAPLIRSRPIIYTGTGPGRGTPPPHSLTGEDLVRARLTPGSWRLEIVPDGCDVARPRTLKDGTAIDFRTLLDLGRTHGVKFLKAMQCRSGPNPQSHGLWEGVPLREVLRLAGRADRVMRVYANGFHNNGPAQIFQSSASYTQVTDNAPGDLPVMVAYRHNGGPIPLLRGGPVRLILPWGYGFKNIKWLQRIRLTGSTNPTDTYGGEPDAYLKTQVPQIDAPTNAAAGMPIVIRGIAVVGLPGLRRVEYWLRPDAGTNGELEDDDPAWQTARWQPGDIDPPPDDWTGHLPVGISPRELWGFDPRTGRPKDWPLRYTVATWSVTLRDLRPGTYEIRVRTVDLNGNAQPQPRPQRRTGNVDVRCKLFTVRG
jgi:DMSO/TMAO reductase YedYZ molybdopterin-dependent catalytic subunit